MLYTDGKHDPPPSGRDTKKVSFKELIKKYYANYKPGKSWFIYYVELDKPDEELEEFLAETKSGKVITPKTMQAPGASPPPTNRMPCRNSTLPTLNQLKF